MTYQQVENNVIAPRAFRDRLQGSSLAVWLTVMVGSRLLDALGAVLTLPMAAAIPGIAWTMIDPNAPGTVPVSLAVLP